MKITDIKVQRLKLIKSLGTLVGFNGPWDINTVNVGGGSFIEVHTDQGLVGNRAGGRPGAAPPPETRLRRPRPFDLQHIISDTKAHFEPVPGTPFGIAGDA